jgi:transcriptional regulator with XRE-family HTH domain
MNRLQDGRTRRERLAREAVDTPRKTLRELSNLYGVSMGSLNAYRHGYRSPSDDNLAKMSEGLRGFARQLLFLREQIEREINENG